MWARNWIVGSALLSAFTSCVKEEYNSSTDGTKDTEQINTLLITFLQGF